TDPGEIRFAKKIAAPELPCVRGPFYPFHNVRDHIPPVVHLERMGRMCEMHFSAPVWKYCQKDNHRDPEPNEKRAPQRPSCAFGHEDAEQSVTGYAEHETPLIADARQQNEACKKRAN